MLAGWLLGPLKEALKLIFNRILAPYVENLDLNQLNYGLSEGQLTLRNLRLKKSALAKFRLPVDVLEGHLGTFSISLHWTNLGNKPAEILIEDLYLLLAPAFHAQPNASEEELREQAVKAEKLANAELLDDQSQVVKVNDGSSQSQGYVEALVARVINNLQITVRNVHIRYEDQLSVPRHKFAAGITLSEVSTISVNENWEATFIESTAGAVRKLLNLESLAVYFDTDTELLVGLSPKDVVHKFTDMISRTADDAESTIQHQFILHPVSGQGRMTMNRSPSSGAPALDFALLFDELSLAVDRHQYHDVLSLADAFNIFERRRQYVKYRPSEQDAKNRWKFAIDAVLADVHEDRRKWSWAYFAERRDNRKKYMQLYSKHIRAPLIGKDLEELHALDKDLSYEDLRMYRGVVRAKHRKEQEIQRKHEAEAQQKPTWGQWLGLTAASSHEVPELRGPETEEERQELYSFAGLSDTDTVNTSYLPKDTTTLQVTASLKKGSFTLKSHTDGTSKDLISAVFGVFHAKFMQRPDSFVATVSLGNLSIYDQTPRNSVYQQIVQVKEAVLKSPTNVTLEPDFTPDEQNSFLYVQFEHNPLDGSADNALTAKLRHMEIIYHRGYVKAIYRFFKPPDSQLESLETLLNVASQRLDGLAKETRLGIALETHKTINLQMDLNAPVIIVPEDITTFKSRVLIIDAGHIAIESELAERKTIQDILTKRQQDRTSEESQRLIDESYDRFSLRLEAAQFILGPDLQSSREALTSERKDTLHLLERTNISLQVERSIAPDEMDLPRIKTAGKLPELHINFSDTKYKAIMGLVDVAIPHFDDTRPSLDTRRSSKGGASRPSLPMLPSVSQGETRDNTSEPSSSVRRVALDDTLWKQIIFGLNFQVESLKVSISKSHSERLERSLGNITLSQFDLDLAVAKFDMDVRIHLRSLNMDLVSTNGQPVQFMRSQGDPDSEQKDLLTVLYHRSQKESPNFSSVYEGIEQNVDVALSTFIFQAAPEPVINVYDFIMTTFVPESSPVPDSLPTVDDGDIFEDAAEKLPEVQKTGKIRARVKLASVQVIILNDDTQVATLSLSTANVSVTLDNGALSLAGRLGSLNLTHDSTTHKVRDEFRHIISIEGENFADFTYRTCDPASSETLGFSSAFTLEAASIKIHFLEGPLHDLYLYLLQLARLKDLYDAARTAAVQRASEMNLVHFNVSIRSPLIILPFDAARSADRLILRLGAINAGNLCTGAIVETNASLHGIGLVSSVEFDGAQNLLDIIGDINVDAHVLQTSDIDRSQDREKPSTQISVVISNVDLSLTHNQYVVLIQLSQSIPRIFQVPAEAISPHETSPGDSKVSPEGEVGLAPELIVTEGENKPWTSLDFVVTIGVVKLHLYDQHTRSQADLENHGIMRFALSENSLRLKLLSDGALEAQVILKSFVMGNKRPGLSKFRQITASKSDRNQFMVLYSQSGNIEIPAQLVVTVDAPQVIFTVDPIVALISFLSLPPQQSAAAIETSTRTTHAYSQSRDHQAANATPSRELNVRMDLHDVSLSVLEDDSNPESQAIRLTISEVLLTKQSVVTLNVDHLKMSLLKMGKNSDEVNILDDVDLSCSLDNRSDASHQTMDIELSSKPIVFRASHRDIMLILSIVNKAISLSNESTSQQSPAPPPIDFTTAFDPSSIPIQAEARAFITTEKLKASFDGVSFVLIGDLNEQPMLHLKLKPFIVGAKDWSSRLYATTTIATQLRYFNLANSHWEPLIDPWTFTVTCGKPDFQGPIQIGLQARERLDLNLTSTFAESAINTANSWAQISQQALSGTRGSYAPYHIRNRTGLRISVWSDNDGNVELQSNGVTIANNDGIDWRFDDWKTMREHVTATSQHSVGLQFIDKSWDHVRGIPVDRAGEYTFVLKSKVERRSHRLLCEVKVVNHTKVVTIRSTVQIHNRTLYTLELMSVDSEHRPVASLEKVNAGAEYALPVEMVGVTNLRVQPDQGFGYKWSQAINLTEIPPRRGFSIKCVHSDPREAAFRFQGWIDSDMVSKSSGLSPKLDLKLRAPIELENLLPFNIQYRIYDKNTDQNWRSYLRQGGVMPVHSVDLGHLVLLNVEIEDTVFKPSEFAIINTDSHADFDVESKLIVVDGANRKLDLKINYVRYPESGGAFKAQIFSPYIVLNKTGLPFKVKSRRPNRSSPEAAGDTRPEFLSTPAPFMLSHIQDKRHEFIFQLGQSDWSEPLSLEAPSAESSLVIPIPSQRGNELHVGVSWTEGLGKYKLSKVVTLAPRFLVKNILSEPISLREHGVAPDSRSLIQPGERVPFLTFRSAEQRLATIAFPGLNTEWSAPFNIEDIGTVHIRTKRPGQTQEELIRCETRLDGSSIFVFLSPAKGGWPFRIENDTDYEFTLSQAQFITEEDGTIKDSPRTNKSYTVNARANLPYAWDYPAAPMKKLIMSIYGAKRTLDMKEIGVLMPFTFTDSSRRRGIVSLDVRAEEHRQVLRISQYNQDKSVYKPQARPPPTPSRSDTASSINTESFEAVTDDVPANFTFNLDLAGIGVSLINKKLLEVIYASLTGLKVDYTTSSVAQSVHLSCTSIQVDNQLHEALYPVILQPTPVSRESTGVAALPTVQASIIWLNDQGHGVFFVKYLSILLQALTIEADEDLLFSLYDLTQIQGVSWEEGVEDKLLVHPTEIPEPSGAQQGQDVYFEVLELQPVKLLLSFMRTERITSDQKLSIRNPVAVVVNALTMAVGNINDAALELNALAIKDMRLTSPELQSRILYHYRQDVIRQLYRLLGSADFIGNPVGLFTNVSSGVADIFYEPFHGVVMHGNKELGIGIAKGAASFVKKTVFGVTDSMTKFTSSVGKGLSAATFDPEYQARRRMAQRRNRPRHALYGVAAGGEAFASSISSAVEGVLFKPMEGADREGAAGFFKGIGKGVMGAVTKPVVGVFDLASNVAEGIRNTTVVFDKAARDRVRLPRHVPADGVLTSYSAREAQGQYWMRDLDNGAFKQESYVAHINAPGGDNVVLLTMSRVLSFWAKNLRLEWEMPFTQVSGVTVEDTGIRFTHKAGRDGNKFVSIPDKSSQTWFFEQVAGVVKNYNKRKKIEKA